MTLFALLFVRAITGPSFQVMHVNLSMFMMLLIGTQAYRRLSRMPLDMKQNAYVLSAVTPGEGRRILQRKARKLA
jgi:hypothetical protein